MDLEWVLGGGVWKTVGQWGWLRHLLWKLMLSRSRKLTSSQGKVRKGTVSLEPLPSYPTLGQTPH